MGICSGIDSARRKENEKIAWMVGLTIIMAILLVGCAEQGKASAETVVKETANLQSGKHRLLKLGSVMMKLKTTEKCSIPLV